MVRVCKEWFPMGSYPRQKDDGFYMDDVLQTNLDMLIKNITDDWDFTIIISGKGEVRVGKSYLAAQIACYLSYEVERIHKKKISFSLKNNYVFHGTKLIEKGHYLGKNFPYSCLVYDEAGSDLEAKKILSKETRKVLDYFRECGQYNLFNIVVIPEFFDLPKSIALSRAICLIDVSYNVNSDGKFERGYFRFFSRPKKKLLYLKGKKELNYSAANKDFHGRFYNMFPLDEKEYRKIKQEALLSRGEVDEGGKYNKILKQVAVFHLKLNNMGFSYKEQIGLLKDSNISLDQRTIYDRIKLLEVK